MSGKQTASKRWRRQIEHIGHGRLLRLLVVVVVVWGLFVPVAIFIANTRQYQLSVADQALIDKVNPNLSAKFSYDSEHDMWQFNKDGTAVQASTIAQAGGASSTADAATALQQLRSQIGGGGKSDDSLYSVDLPTDASKGMTYYDNDTGLSFTMTPQFKARSGKKWQDRVIYPADNGAQLVYTAKTNGLKEDIILDHAVGDEQEYNYKLQLPETLEARLQDDGSLGIYSADTSLYGNITFSSAEDQARVMDARQTAPKNHLVFAIPAPVIKDSAGHQTTGTFTYGGGELTVYANHLSQLTYPITIDPSVAITSSSDFSAGNNEDSIDFSTSGQITNGGISGGTLSSGWTTNGSTLGSSYGGLNAVTYNGYVYNTYGYSSSLNPVVLKMAINSNHSLSSPTVTGGSYTQWGQTIAYNGYLYVLGGGTNTGVAYASLDPITGTVGSWANTSTMTTARRVFGAVAYNGYMYAVGGDTGSGYATSVEYAPIHADGTLGSWTTTTSYTGSGRKGLTATVYNGYLYVAGGTTSGGYLNTVLYAPLNANGTVGAWASTSSFTTARYTHTAAAANGYMYILGGSSDGGSTGYNDVQYAQINANGSLGTWYTTSSFTNGRANHSGFFYNGYLYILGGSGSSNFSDIQYAKIDPVGQTAFAPASTTFSTARDGICAAAYNGYIYGIGGSPDDGSTAVATVQYATLNGTTGDTGSWSATTSLPATRAQAGCVAANGRLYVAGGWISGDPSTATKMVYYATINSDGTLGSWTSVNLASSGTDGWTDAAAFVYTAGANVNLYVVGGGETGHATLNPTTGALGTWDDADDAMPPSEQSRAYAQVGNYLYAIGGSGGVDDVYYATIQSNGSIGAWASTTDLPIATGWTTATTVNGCMYVVGGNDGSDNLSAVQYACPNSSGTISAWYRASDLATPTSDIGVTSYNGYIYGIGGFTNGVVNSAVAAKVNNGGSGKVGSWTSSSAFPSSYKKTVGGTVAYNGYLYYVGGAWKDGSNNFSWSNDVYYAPLNKDGTVGTWTVSPNGFTTGRGFTAATAYNGYLYVLGGSGNGTAGSSQSDVQYAPINADGSIGAWSTATSFATARYMLAATAYNGYMYVLGGANSSDATLNDVQYASINSNGALGSWTATTSMSGSMGRGISVVVNGSYMYALGGTSDGNAGSQQVQYASINSNGALGSWTATTSMLTGRWLGSATAYNGFLYALGGYSTSNLTATANVEFAPISSNGSIGPWTAATAFTNSRHGQGAAMYNGYAYIVGGSAGDGSSYYGDTQYASLDSIARVAHYSKLVALPNAAGGISVSYNGSFNNDTTVRTAVAGTNGVLASGSAATSGAGVDPGKACVVPTTNYVWVFATLDDSRRAVFGNNGGLSSLTDITVYYADTAHSQPANRLHGGKYFGGQVLQPLDTCTL